MISTTNGLFVVIILYSAACGYDIHFPSILPLLKTSKGNVQICSTTLHPLAKNGRSNSGSGVYWARCCSSMTSRIGGWKGVNATTRIGFLAATEVGKFPPKRMAVRRGRRGSRRQQRVYIVLSISYLLFVSGDEVLRGGAPPSSRLARRRRGYQVLSYSSKSEYSMNKQQHRNNIPQLTLPAFFSE